MITLVDNTPTVVPSSSENEGLRLVANQSIGSLISHHPELLVFPQCLDDCEDDLKKQTICTMYENIDANGDRQMNITPTNVVGYIGVQDTKISICSRFSPKKGLGADYFLHYLLQKALSVNLFNLEHNYTEDDQVFDFLLLLFPGMLKQAIAQGLYKEYKTYSRNDANVKGGIEVVRHLRLNVPFNGNVAYRSREISYDNSVTELIRHTIEYIRSNQFGRTLLSSEMEIVECVSQIVTATPTYTKGDRNRIVRANQKPVAHPFYTKYKPLQNLCIRILRHQKIRYGDTSKRIYGILFDMSWLWEEYMAKILSDYTHPQNRKGTNPVYLGDNGAMIRFPDLYKGESDGVVLDAKYKNDIDRNDQHQVISYMYRLKSRYGGLLMPSKGKVNTHATDLLGYGKKLALHYLMIPQEAETYQDFVREINTSEEAFRYEIHSKTTN